MSQAGTGKPPLVQLISQLQGAGIDWDAENIADWLWLARYIEAPASQGHSRPDGESKPAAVRSDATIVSASAPAPPPAADLSLYPQSRPRPQATTLTRSGIPFQAATAPALRRTLSLGRALRPLMRKVDSYTQTVLDEIATAEQTAERRFCLSVTRPAREHWLEVALVVEATPLLPIWRETLRDFQQVLERQGAFRTLSVWYLHTDSQGTLQLLA